MLGLLLGSRILKEIQIKRTILSGRRIRLEPLTAGHHAVLCAIGLDPRLWERTTIRVQTAEDMRRYIELALRWEEEGSALPFVIVESGSGQVIGTTRFHHVSTENRRVEIGFTWIGVPWQGSGVNVEAKYLMLRHAFEVWGCVRVEFKADSENEPSRRALERIGATCEATLRQSVGSLHRGMRDLAVYSILAPEWPAVEASLRVRLPRDAI